MAQEFWASSIALATPSGPGPPNVVQGNEKPGAHRRRARCAPYPVMLQDASDARFHLMGHSFGCIMMTAATAGPVSGGQMTDPLPRPIDSLFLVQGAMSLWSFAERSRLPPNAPGYSGCCANAAVCKARRDHDIQVTTVRSVPLPWARRARHERTSAPSTIRVRRDRNFGCTWNRSRPERMEILNADAALPIHAGHHVQH